MTFVIVTALSCVACVAVTDCVTTAKLRRVSSGVADTDPTPLTCIVFAVGLVLVCTVMGRDAEKTPIKTNATIAIAER
jgi:hypothetical protein